MEGLKFSDMVNMGAALVFMVLTFLLYFKFLPIYQKNGEKQAEAWDKNAASNLELAKALTGLQVAQGHGFGQCNTYHDAHKKDLVDTESRLTDKISEVKDVIIIALRNVEEINAWHKAQAAIKKEAG